MKRTKNISTRLYGLYVASICLILPSCSKFLEIDAKEVLVEDQVYRNIYDADAAVIGVYGKLLSLAEQHVVLNELRGDLLSVTRRANPYLQEINRNDVSAMSADNPYISPRKFYEVILNCNDVLANFDRMHTDRRITPEEYQQRFSDIMAVRTWVYLQLGIHFGRVPYVTDALENVDAVQDATKYPLLEFEQLLARLIEDMEAIPYKRLYPDTESLMFTVDGYQMERFFVNKLALLGDLYLWNNNYRRAAEYYKEVMTYYDGIGHDNTRFDRYKIKRAEIATNDDIAVGYLRYREQDIRTLINSKTQGWRSMFSRTQDFIWNTEWVWVLPFNSNFAPPNPFIPLFASNGGNHLLQPSQEIFHLWESQTQQNGVPYDARRDLSVTRSGQDYVVNKYTDEYYDIATMLPVDEFQRNGKWHLYRAAKLHLRFSEAANRDNQHRVAIALLNSGIPGEFSVDPMPSDVTDIMNTLHLPPPYDFDGRQGNNPFFRSTWHRNGGIRGRARLTFREVTNPADSLLQIENHLIEEAALEMAFEGSRWEDLLRVARRRQDPAFLADKVYEKLSKEGHPQAEAVRSKLMQPENWYLPFRWSEAGE